MPEIYEDSLRKTFTLERQLECFIRAVARRELSHKELRSWLESHVPAIYEDENNPLTHLGDAAFDILFQADYHGDGEAIIRGFCKLANLPYGRPVTTASSRTIYAEMLIP